MSVALGVLALLAVINLWPVVCGISKSVSDTYPEGWNAYHTARVLTGEKVYEYNPQFVTANYPPLFWELVALFARKPASIVTTGRVISLISFSSTTLLLGLITFKLTNNNRAGVLTALVFLTWMSTAANGYLVTNEPQMLAHALICAGLLSYVTVGDTLPGLCLSGFLFCVALFVKNNVIAVPLAVSCHLMLSSWRQFAKWAALNGIIAVGLLGFVMAHDGQGFLRDLLAPRSYSFKEVLYGARVFTDAFQIPLIAAVVWSCYNIRNFKRNLLIAILTLSLVVAVMFRGGGGTNFNMFFDAIIALGLISGVAVSDLMESLPSTSIGGLLVALSPLFLCFWSVTRIGPSMFTPVLHGKEIRAASEREYLAGLVVIQAHPGLAICETIRLCFDAGKPLVYDPYYVNELVKTGHVQESTIAADLEHERYSVIQLDHLFDVPGPEPGRLFFGPNLMKVMREHYRVGLATSSYVLLVPKKTSDGTG